MPTQMDCFDEFLRKVDPLMGSLYRSLDFVCLAARSTAGWALISGRAVLSNEPLLPGGGILELDGLPSALVALRGRIDSKTVNNLIVNLRNSWVIDRQRTPEKILLMGGKGNYSWRMPYVHITDPASKSLTKWSRDLRVEGVGPDVSPLVSYEIESELRSRRQFMGFDSLCEYLGLNVRRSNLLSSFIISAELPARFRAVLTDSQRHSLEIEIECLAVPELLIEWRPPQPPLEVRKGWQRHGETDSYHTSVPLRAEATEAELRLAFGEIDEVDVRRHDIFGPESSPYQASLAGGVKGFKRIFVKGFRRLWDVDLPLLPAHCANWREWDRQDFCA